MSKKTQRLEMIKKEDNFIENGTLPMQQETLPENVTELNLPPLLKPAQIGIGSIVSESSFA